MVKYSMDFLFGKKDNRPTVSQKAKKAYDQNKNALHKPAKEIHVVCGVTGVLFCSNSGLVSSLPRGQGNHRIVREPALLPDEVEDPVEHANLTAGL